MSAPEPISWAAFDAAVAKLDAERVVMLARAERIRRCLAVGVAILGMVAIALPWAEARIDDWAANEEAKAAQAWRRTP